MSLWSLSHQEAGPPGLSRTQNLPTRHPGRGVNSQATKTVVNVTGKSSVHPNHLQGHREGHQVGRRQVWSLRLSPEWSAFRWVNYEELINAHLPAEVQWPCCLLLVAPNHSQLWIVDVFLFVLGNRAYWLINSVHWPDLLRIGSPILFLIVASGPSILVLLSREYWAYNKKIPSSRDQIASDFRFCNRTGMARLYTAYASL